MVQFKGLNFTALVLMVEQVQFEEPSIQEWRVRVTEPEGLTGFLIKNGVAKDTSQANVILIVTIIAALVFMFFYWSGGPEADLAPASEIINRQQFLP